MFSVITLIFEEKSVIFTRYVIFDDTFAVHLIVKSDVGVTSEVFAFRYLRHREKREEEEKSERVLGRDRKRVSLARLA